MSPLSPFIEASAIKSSGLEPTSSPKVPGAARFHDLFHDVALLIHLDREHAAVAALVLVLLHRAAESLVDAPDAVRQDVREAHQERQLDARARMSSESSYKLMAFADEGSGVTSTWPFSFTEK
jgi:hypothetical protein